MSMFRKDVPAGFVTAFGPKLRVRVDASATDESPGAIQSFREECDINNIMTQVERTGVADWRARMPGSFEDVTGIDFQSSMDKILRAQEAFDALPSAIRDRFGYDPARFLMFCEDKANQEELVRLGLADAPPPPPPPEPTPGAS